MYDIIVIGKGMMGAAAARHLVTQFPDLSVAVIGPDEPLNRKTHTGVFASHYDQGRITRILDRSPVWAYMAAESIKRYRAIEAESGISFFYPVGCLRVHDGATAIEEVKNVAAQFNPTYSTLTPEQTEQHFPYFHFGDDYTAFYETQTAGYINPRLLVAAQVKAAEKRGAHIIRQTVKGFTEKSDHIEIETVEGETLQAKKALITAGGFTNLLLSRELKMKLTAHHILLAEIPDSEIERLAGMPSLITKFEQNDLPSLYMVPPVIYLDGKTYIKLGGSSSYVKEDPLISCEELTAWFQSDGRADIAAQLKTMLHTLISNLQVNTYQTHPCLLADTPNFRPYIDEYLSEKVYITACGNGAAAKSSDEIGRMGAVLCATGEWDSPLKQEEFKLIF